MVDVFVNLTIPRHRLSAYGRSAFAVASSMTFSAMPDDLRDPFISTAAFGHSLKTHLFSTYQHVLHIRVVSHNALCYINLRYLFT